MKKFFTFIAMALISIGVFAQENNNRDVNGKVASGPYLTNNGLFDNTFVGVGGGVNTFYYNTMSFENFKHGYAVDGFVGKWFTPTVGVRVGYKGLTNVVNHDNNFRQHFVHGDVMWNISNAIGGYKETRFWDFVPYARAGVLMVKADGANGLDNEYAAGAGLYNKMRLSNRVGLYLDVNAVLTKAAQFGVRNHRLGLVPSASVGVVLNLGKTGFVRHETALKDYVPSAVYNDMFSTFTKADNDKSNKLAALEQENTKLRSLVDSLKNAPAKEVFRDVEISTVTIYFDKGQYTISNRELAHLDYYASNANKENPITITGSADWGTGSDKRNRYLAEQRALAVKKVLIEKYGFDANKISVDVAKDVFDKATWSRVAVVE